MRLSSIAIVGGLATVISSQTFAADLVIEETTVATIESSSSRFDGFYAGVFVGYGGAKFSGIVDSDELPGDPEDTETFPDEWSMGLVYGGYVGVGVVEGSIYYGGEISLTGGNFGGYAEDEGPFDFATNDFSYLATVRGRLGVVLSDQTLIYGTAGFGFIGSDFTAHDDIDSENDVGRTNMVLPAAIVGAGVEQGLTDTISVRLEGLYVVPFGEYTFTENELTPDMDDNDFAGVDGAFQLTAGLTFHF